MLFTIASAVAEVSVKVSIWTVRKVYSEIYNYMYPGVDGCGRHIELSQCSRKELEDRVKELEMKIDNIQSMCKEK